jgi:hypothetical protein
MARDNGGSGWRVGGANVSIKESAETWVRGAPGQALILVAAVGIVIGGVAGLGAGFKIEQNRTRSDVKKLRTELQGAGGAGGSGATTPTASASLGQRIGKVTASSAGTLSLATKRKGAQDVHTTSATQFESLAKGSTADIVVGRRVLVTVPGNAVIVLASTSRLGRAVQTVATDSFTLAKTNNAKAGSIPMNKIKEVDTTTPATLADFKVGSEVLSGGRGTGQDFSAAEVILLPAGSPFAN